MKQIFNNLRAILTRHKENLPVVTVAEMLAEIDEAEAKWGCHAICYLDSPCEYQSEDINVAKVDEHYKKIRARVIDEFAEKLVFQAVCQGCSGCCNCYELGRQMQCGEYKRYMEIAEQLKEE